jgi:hypothetical protein
MLCNGTALLYLFEIAFRSKGNISVALKPLTHHHLLLKQPCCTLHQSKFLIASLSHCVFLWVLTQQLAPCFKNVLNGPKMALSMGCNPAEV